MKSYLRKIVDSTVAGKKCPINDLESIREGIPMRIVNSEWSDVIMGIFLEKGDTAYAREGYHGAVELIEKHLFQK